jgi:cytochrome c-type biogenesis protein CcmH/NrfG
MVVMTTFVAPTLAVLIAIGTNPPQDRGSSESAEALHQRGLELQKKKDLAGAIAAFRAAVRREPRAVVSWTALGLALIDANSLVQARSALTKATALAPDDGLAWGALGRLELRRKKIPAAIRALEKAHRLQPKDPTIGGDYCEAMVGHTPLAEATIDQCHDALALDPSNARARLMLGKSLVAQGKCYKAKGELSRVVIDSEVDPKMKTQAEALTKSCVRAKSPS